MIDFVNRELTNAEKYTLRQSLFGDANVQPLWVADMDIATPTCVLDAVDNRLQHGVVGYEIMPDSAYEAQVQWFKKQHDYEMKREWLSYSPSVVASIGCAIRSFSEVGDEVVVMSPVYPPFFHQVTINNRTVLHHSLHQGDDGKYRFDIQVLQQQISPKTKMLLLCSPHNPVGRVWSTEELTQLGEFCLRNAIVIVSDEIHCDLVYDNYKHIPMASISETIANQTVTFMGTGKTFNMAGFSISTVCIASEYLRKKFELETKKVHWGDGALLSHVAFEAAYLQGGVWQDELMKHLRDNRQRLMEFFAPTPIKMTTAEATYLAWLDCRALGMGDKQLREFFVQRCELGLSAGLSFGREGSGFMRLNFAISREALERALQKIQRGLDGL
jgi:cystathionine beta-lyase